MNQLLNSRDLSNVSLVHEKVPNLVTFTVCIFTFNFPRPLVCPMRDVGQRNYFIACETKTWKSQRWQDKKHDLSNTAYTDFTGWQTTKKVLTKNSRHRFKASWNSEMIAKYGGVKDKTHRPTTPSGIFFKIPPSARANHAPRRNIPEGEVGTGVLSSSNLGLPSLHGD